jgi:Fe-S cluster assembly ATP-binding protein
MLEITNLHVSVDGKEIIRGLNLKLQGGQVHAIMGPNGSGKSTLSYVLAGRDGYEVTQGAITFNGKDLLAMEADARAHAGVFLAFQYPVAVPGVSNKVFLRHALNSIRKARGDAELTAVEFLRVYKAKLKVVGMDAKLANREVNKGFSGGEKKRNEVLQMAILEPSLCVLDETDSGLDIDALKAVAEGVNALRAEDRAMLVITHYQRLLDYIVPDKVHVLVDGKIVRTGDKDLALQLEERGYDWLRGEAA